MSDERETHMPSGSEPGAYSPYGASVYAHHGPSAASVVYGSALPPPSFFNPYATAASTQDALAATAFDPEAHGIPPSAVQGLQQQQAPIPAVVAFKPRRKAGLNPDSYPPDAQQEEMKRIQKAAKKKLREHNRNLTCHNCGTTSSPLWRRTPDKLHNLCNACGLYYKEHKAMRPANKIARKPAGDFGGGTVEITAPNPASYTFPRPAQIAASQAAASQAAAQSTAAQSYYVAANAASSSSNATLFYTAPDGTQGFFQPSQQVGYDMPMMRAAQDYVAAGMGGGVAASKLPLPSPDEFLQQSREAAGVLQQPLSSYYTSQQYQVSGSNESGSQ